MGRTPVLEILMVLLWTKPSSEGFYRGTEVGFYGICASWFFSIRTVHLRVVSLQIPPAASHPLPDVKLCSLAAYPPSVGRMLYPPLPRTWSCEQALYHLPPIPSQRTTLYYCWSLSWFLACRLGQPRSHRREHPYHPTQTCKSQKYACLPERKGGSPIRALLPHV